MRYLVVLAFVSLIMACHHPAPVKTAKTTTWTPNVRCRTLGTSKINNWGVVVHKDCWKKGLTTVTFFFKPPVSELEYRDALNAAKTILGYPNPKLFPLFTSKDRNVVIILMGVGE